MTNRKRVIQQDHDAKRLSLLWEQGKEQQEHSTDVYDGQFKKGSKIDAAGPEITSFLLHSFFFLVETCHLHHPRCNSTSDRNHSSIQVCYAHNSQCGLKPRCSNRAKERATEVWQVHLFQTFFQFQTCDLQSQVVASSDITLSNLSEFAQLPVEPQKALYNDFFHM